ncbi:uncharacterized protein LOC112101523, partial [Citrus clementina]|uniref:uncharacterized protein LOC112101523 n=1 Tax=Citrus clementina TaxID=85681 RepID=UPI000CECFA3F
IVLPPSECEPSGNRGGQASGSGENCCSGGAEIPEGKDGDEESNSRPNRPSMKRNLGHRMEADFYPIDDLKFATTHTDLLNLRTLYNIPGDVILSIPGKGDVPSRPPKGYVTLHLESFKLGARLPLQPYFARILGSMYLVPGQLHPNGWRVLSALFVLWERCKLGEPSLVEIKHLYQLRSNLKEADSWGMVNKLDDDPLLNVETSLVNASTCRDLLSPTNLVGSRMVDVAVGLDNKILSAMPRKRGRALGESSDAPSTQKKSYIAPSKTPAPALHPPPPRKNGREKLHDKSPEVSTQSRD